MHSECMLTGFSVLRPAARTYDLLEIGIVVGSLVGSPFRADEIAIDAEGMTPSGRVMRVPAFFDGDAGWRLRFAGREPGEYNSALVLRLAGQETAHLAGPRFALARGPGHGFVRCVTGSHYLEFEDGTAYLPVGQNVCFTRAKARQIPIYPDHNAYVPFRSPDLPWDQAYQCWFTRMSENGANWARIWVGSPDFDMLDGPPWQFNVEHARRLDAIVELAARLGIHLCMCLDYWRNLLPQTESISTSNWFSARDRAWGRLLLAEGGDGKEDMFTSPGIAELLRDLARYSVARWGWFTHIFAWELWNEIECLVNASQPAELEWVRPATRDIRQADPWGHLVKSSAHHDGGASLRGPEFGDLSDIHMYFGWTGTATACRCTSRCGRACSSAVAVRA